MKKLLTEKTILVTAGILILLAFLFSSYTIFKSFTLKPGESTVISGGATVKKPTNNIVDASLRADGYLVVKYEDGSTREVGYILGEKGDKGDSISPTQAQIAVAVTNYCQENNRCDAKSPSPEQVAAAVSTYCSSRSECAGITGQNATDTQVMTAVAQYCSDGRCKGLQGDKGIQGVPGANGKTPVLACVSRQELTGLPAPADTSTKFYVAWGYTADSHLATDWTLLYKINSNDVVKPCTTIA